MSAAPPPVVPSPLAGPEQSSHDVGRIVSTQSGLTGQPGDILTVQEAEEPDDVHPEGGLQAWLCVLGSFCALFPSYGFMQTSGTIQSYLETNQLKDYTSRDVGWIISVYTWLALVLGIQVGPLFDRYGPRILNLIGSVLYVAQFFLLAQCTKYWHFMLCLGVLGGIGAALISTIGMAIMSNWFSKRRGVAMGIAMCGSSLGGVVMPILLRTTFPKLGWTWSIRIIAFLVLFMLTVANIFIRPNPRLAQRHHTNIGVTTSDTTTTPTAKKRKPTLDLSAFGSVPFTFITVCLSSLEFVIFGATGILPTYATTAKFNPDSGFYIIAILNGASCFGRALPGLAADHLGPFNVLSSMIIFTLLSMCIIWLPFGSTSLVALYIFSAFWGFGTGSFLSVTPICVGKTCDTRDYGRYFGTAYFVVSFALLLTVPLSAQVLQTAGTQALSGFYVAVLGFGFLCIICARWAMLGWKWKWKVTI